MTASWCQLGLCKSPGRIDPLLWTWPPFPGVPALSDPAHLHLHRYGWEREQGSVALSVTQDPACKKSLG